MNWLLPDAHPHRLYRRSALLVSLTCLVALLAAGGAAPLASAAGPAALVRDINASTLANPEPLSISVMAAAGERLFFIVGSSAHSGELWVTDSIPGGMRLVYDFVPDPQGSPLVSGEMIGMGPDAYFTIDRRLWRSDGSTIGTRRVSDVYLMSEPMVAQSQLYFTGSRGADFGIWKSDGSTQGTALVAPFPAGTSDPTLLAAAGDRLFFLFDDGVNGRELWATRGTAETTGLVRDLTPGGDTFPAGGSEATPEVAVVDDTLYFSTGRLWKSDGTLDGTVQIAPDVKEVESLVNAGGTLYFHGVRDVDYMSHSTGLWKSAGTTATTVEVHSFDLSLNNYRFPTALHAVGTSVLFLGPGDGDTLWVSDGTAQNTASIAGVSFAQPDQPYVHMGGKLYFAGVKGGDTELWRSDGTIGGTVLVKDLDPVGSGEPHQFVATAGNIYFNASSGTDGMNVLWRSDGTGAGTLILKSTLSLPSAIRSQQQFVPVGGQVFFVATDGGPQALWTSDGTFEGTVLLHKPAAEYVLVAVVSSPLAGQLAFFRGNVAGGGVELWLSDGTPGGTRLVKQLPVDIRGPTGVGLFQGSLFFSMWNDTESTLWRTDGTAAGTVKVAMLPWLSRPGVFAEANGRLFFDAGIGNQRELWVSDGTAAGTVSLKIPAPRELTPLGSVIYFMSGRDLWRSNGTVPGTVRLATVGNYDFYPREGLTVVGDRLFFRGFDDLGVELWTSDGTAAGTRRVKDINPRRVNPAIVGDSSTPRDLVDLNGVLLFTADDGVHGRELWRSDGTEVGTQLVKDINIAETLPRELAGSGVMELTLATLDGWALLAASNGVDGLELWRTRGTAATTVQLQEIVPGPGSSSPDSFVVAGDHVFFGADDGVHGRELWSIRRQAVTDTVYYQAYLPFTRR